MKSEKQRIEELKVQLEKNCGRKITDEEASQAYKLMDFLAEMAFNNALTEAKRLDKLKENPNGFPLEESGTCAVCGQPTSNENSWYDKNGLKCIPCQKAIDNKLVPVSIIGKKESWYSKHDLECYFNIDQKDLKKYVKQGFLNKRVIYSDNKNIHLELFLIKDNKAVLPPKKLLPSKIIKFEKNGEEYYTHAQWYECIDLKGLKKLQKYKISEILSATLAKPINTGSFYWKKMNPLLSPF